MKLKLDQDFETRFLTDKILSNEKLQGNNEISNLGIELTLHGVQMRYQLHYNYLSLQKEKLTE